MVRSLPSLLYPAALVFPASYSRQELRDKPPDRDHDKQAKGLKRQDERNISVAARRNDRHRVEPAWTGRKIGRERVDVEHARRDPSRDTTQANQGKGASQHFGKGAHCPAEQIPTEPEANGQTDRAVAEKE